MSTALQVLEPNGSRADLFFDRKSVVTDWDEVRGQVTEGLLTEAECLATLKTFEPLEEADMREHAHWVAQQKLRLVLTYKAGKPLLSKHICPKCGFRQADSLFITSYRASCLHCREQDKQQLDTGSRGSCEFLQVTYNHRTYSWGLLNYWSPGRDNAFIFWVADFFPTRQAALEALRPMFYYQQWLDHKYNNMLSYWGTFSRLLGLDQLMKMSLPMTPEQFRECLRTEIEKDMNREHSVMDHYVSDAMRNHKEKERD